MSSELLHIIHEIRHSGAWSVVLVPKRFYKEALTTAAAICDAEMEGRTLRWVDRPGKVTFCYAEMENPVPKDTAFDLYLAAWHSSDEKDRRLALDWIQVARRLPASNSNSWDQTPLSRDILVTT